MLTDYEIARKMENTHQCRSCGHKSVLVTRWNAAAKSYEVICGGCKAEDGFVGRMSLTQQWRLDPASVPIYIANRLEKRYGGKPMGEMSLTTLSQKAMTERIEGVRFLRDLNAQDRSLLARLAVQYGFDPVMGELTVYEGRPYITLAGYIRVAHRQPAFEGLEDRPMSSDEKKIYGITAPIAWRATVYRAGWRVPAVGTGTANPEAPLRNNPIERTQPYVMARSRAIRQALKLAFPHALPFESAEDAGVYVDTETGEITVHKIERDTNGVDAGKHSEPTPEVPAKPAPVAKATPASAPKPAPEPEEAPIPDDEVWTGELTPEQKFEQAIATLPELTQNLACDWFKQLKAAPNQKELNAVGQKVTKAKESIPGDVFLALGKYYHARYVVLGA